ncbi:Uncharacterised protein [Vibrio cholerae]|nr:Uncharacterised protein [Vibrio cholerae]
MITERFGSPSLTRKIEAPPIPSRGFRITSPCCSRKALIFSALRVTIVIGVSSGNQAVNSFSLQSRRLCGLFTTNTPSSSARSKM